MTDPIGKFVFCWCFVQYFWMVIICVAALQNDSFVVITALICFVISMIISMSCVLINDYLNDMNDVSDPTKNEDYIRLDDGLTTTTTSQTNESQDLNNTLV